MVAALLIGGMAAKNNLAAAPDPKSQKTLGKNRPPVAGGAQQVTATEGKTGQWLFNGIWRVCVLKVAAIRHPLEAERPGVGVLVEFRNGSKKTLTLHRTGVEGKPVLMDSDGNAPTLDENDWQIGAYFKDLIPAQSVRHEIKFYYPAGATAESLQSALPEKLILLMDPKNGLLRDTGLKYSVKDPSFRIFLK